MAVLSPDDIVKSKFKQLQETGNEAEFFFMSNYKTIPVFETGLLQDARLWGDGYDFQIQLQEKSTCGTGINRSAASRFPFNIIIPVTVG